MVLLLIEAKGAGMKIVRNSRLAKALMLGLPAVLASAMLAAPAQAATEITFQTWNSQDSQDKWNAMTAAFMKANPDIIVKTNFVPGGVEGDALVKSQLASGTMTDVFAYNVGALMQAIDPVRNLVNLKNEPWMKSVNTGFIPSATGADGGVYAAPFGTAMGGGILYNKRIYSKLGLQIPLTWKEFMANNAKIKKAGITPVISSWTLRTR